VLKFGNFEKYIRESWKVLKCVSGAEWRRPFQTNTSEIKKYYIETRRRGISCKQYEEERLTGWVTSGVGTAL